MNAVPPAEAGRWVTPPPTFDGSSVWSGEEYSSSVESMYRQDPNYLVQTTDAGYANAVGARHPSAYPYYSVAGQAGSDLPPYWPRPASMSTAVDGYAITSLIFAIIGGWILGLGFGIAALRRIATGARRGRGLAIGGLALSALWFAVDLVWLLRR